MSLHKRGYRKPGMSKTELASWLLRYAKMTNPDCASHMKSKCLERPDLGKTGGERGGYTDVYFQGKMWLAHRLINEVYCGGPLGDLNSLHHCDNKLCINPSHLYRGTQRENANDMFDRNRTTHVGVRNANASLNARKVLTIRKMVAQGHEQKAVAKKFGINPSHVWKIVHRKVWTHV